MGWFVGPFAWFTRKTSGGEPHPADLLKHALKWWRWRHAQGWIRVQEGQPRNSLMSC
jgi:hypothetical protein